MHFVSRTILASPDHNECLLNLLILYTPLISKITILDCVQLMAYSNITQSKKIK